MSIYSYFQNLSRIKKFRLFVDSIKLFLCRLSWLFHIFFASLSIFLSDYTFYLLLFCLFSHFISFQNTREISWKPQFYIKTHSISNKKFCCFRSIVKNIQIQLNLRKKPRSNFGAFFYSITLKRYSVFSLYSSPAFKTTLGNCGHAIAFGKCCVSRQKPSRSW